MGPANNFARKAVMATIVAIFAANKQIFADSDVADKQANLFDMQIEDLAEQSYTVYGASKYEQKISDAPAYVTIVTADEIRKYGYKTLADHYADNFWITNLTMTYENLVKGLELSASVYNLFDVDYGHPGGGEHVQDIIEQDGRSFRVKLTYRF
jgi:outer membrane receptor for ferrienterochelin and colicin